MLTQFGVGIHTDAFFGSVALEGILGGHDKGRDELALVGHDNHLLDEAIDDKLRLDHLGRNILAV